MKASFKIVIIITSFVFLFDQLTKYLVLQNFEILSSVFEVFKGFNLVYVENKGVSFGIFSELNIPFYLGVLSLIISAYIVFLISQSTSILEIYSLSMILGGALGNGYDRLLQGYVIDFIDIYYIDYHWPAFNIADSFITIGAFLFLYSIVKKKKKLNLNYAFQKNKVMLFIYILFNKMLYC